MNQSRISELEDVNYLGAFAHYGVSLRLSMCVYESLLKNLGLALVVEGLSATFSGGDLRG